MQTKLECFKSAVAFFFLFFIHGTSIGNGQQGISYNTQITGGVLNVTTGPFDLTPKREIKVIMIEGYDPFDCLIIGSSDNLFLGHFNDGVVE